MQSFTSLPSRNNTLKADMATVSKAIGEFKANEGEGVERWVANAQTTGRLYNLSDQEMVGAVVLALRGEARDWAMSALERNPNISWSEMRDGIQVRFASQKETQEVVSRFFASPPATDYKSFMSMLRDADLMLRRGCLTNEHLMKQVIVRAPVDIKAMLLQLAYEGCDWDTFRSRAENTTWIAFPDNIINVVSKVAEPNVNQVRSTKQEFSRRQHCRLHGDCDHSTKDCAIVKLVESKGWRRKPMNVNSAAASDEDSIMNKEHCNYSSKFLKNPFYFNGVLTNANSIKGKQVKLLLDTGADVSIISEKLLPDKTTIETGNKENVRSACGNKLDIVGCTKGIEASVGNQKLNFEPLVTKEYPKDYAIIGVDALKNNVKAFTSIMSEGMEKACELSGKERKICKVEVQERYKDMFKNELNQMTVCKIVAHRINTTTEQPIVQRNFQIPKLLENEIDQQIRQLSTSGIIEESESS